MGIALSTGIGLLWLNQQAIERYWQQTRHAPSPFSEITLSIWQTGSQLEGHLEAQFQQLEQWLMPAQDIAADAALVDDNEECDDDSVDTDTLPEVSVTPLSKPDTLPMKEISGQPASDGKPLDMSAPHEAPEPSHAAEIPPPERPPAANEETAHPALTSPEGTGERRHSLVLTPQDRVLFIGDSMMQGVAPHVMKTLLKQYHVQSTNLSLQSTGLAYPNAFDWPGTLRTTLSTAADIKVLVVFLGPNDPWDMPTRVRGPYLKFKSQAWESEYRSRIRNILEQAKEHDIAVIWIGPPAMKRVVLSEGVRFLDTLYQSEVEAAGQTYIAVDDLFGYQDHHYVEPVTLNGRQVKLRSDDGTHFTVTGQKLIARAVLDRLQPALTDPTPARTPEQTSTAPIAPPSAPPANAQPALPSARTPRQQAADQVFSAPETARSRQDHSTEAAQVFIPRF